MRFWWITVHRTRSGLKHESDRGERERGGERALFLFSPLRLPLFPYVLSLFLPLSLNPSLNPSLSHSRSRLCAYRLRLALRSPCSMLSLWPPRSRSRRLFSLLPSLLSLLHSFRSPSPARLQRRPSHRSGLCCATARDGAAAMRRERGPSAQWRSRRRATPHLRFSLSLSLSLSLLQRRLSPPLLISSPQRSASRGATDARPVRLWNPARRQGKGR